MDLKLMINEVEVWGWAVLPFMEKKYDNPRFILHVHLKKIERE